ncbi:MAG: DUF1634 domain-containing protein [Terriglobales bacterium]
MALLPNWTDRKIEEIVADLLRAGVAISALVVFVGACFYLARYAYAPADYRVFQGEPTDLRNLLGIAHSAKHLRSRGIIQLGLVCLIATPVARVAFSIWGFAAEHDRLYMIFTGIVLAILLYSLLGSGSAF